MSHLTDPVEREVHTFLKNFGLAHTHEGGRNHPDRGLDFHLTDLNIHMECKRFHTPRAIEQMSRFENVILVQGLEAARFLAKLERKF